MVNIKILNITIIFLNFLFNNIYSLMLVSYPCKIIIQRQIILKKLF